ncbi:protransforming growth factor alpha [Ictalurus punctatus]|uniref:Protransforming growth factor alpha n=1 Tax=Ictalurus punctatus TaxID=7998 RepID=A0A2D0RXM0_ICTPU|nr:protransforming growth factor alpha [Ictalurus punctatus]
MYRAFWDTIFLLSGYLFTYSQVQQNATSAATTMAMTPTTTATITATITATNTTAVSSTTVRRKFIAAAVHSHFADCPDSHSHFCIHGTCRFLILEETQACVCHPGFIGVRCEYADLLAVVATNQRQHTLATILMLGILGSVLLVLLCTIINCWWRRGRWRQGPLLSCLSKKPNGIVKSGTSCCHTETVV